MKRQGIESAKLPLHEKLDDHAAGGLMEMRVGPVGHPPPRHGPEIIQVLKLARVEEIALNELKRLLHFSLRFGPPRPTSHGLASVMGDEGDKRGIKDRTHRLPAEHHRLFSVVEAFIGRAAKVLEGIPVPPDERVEIPGRDEVDILSPGKPQDVGKAQHRGFSGTHERDGIRAPVHLPLLAGLGLEADHRFTLGPLSHGPQPVPEDRDPSRVSGIPELLEHAHARYVGEFLDEPPHQW